MTWHIYVISALAALFAETLERAGADRALVPQSSWRGRVAELGLTVLIALIFAYHAGALVVSGDHWPACLGAVLGAVLARIAISDIRLAMVPDELSVVFCAVLPIWKWMALSGQMPQFHEAALLGAAGISVLLSVTLLFVFVRWFVIPPIDAVLALAILTMPASPGDFYVAAGSLALCLMIRRRWPGVLLLLMRPETIRAARDDAAAIFGEDGRAQPQGRYFPMAPLAAVALTACVVFMTVFG